MKRTGTPEGDKDQLPIVPDHHSFLLNLLGRRKALGLKPNDVATCMGIARSSFYELERRIRDGDNIMFGTVFNYARAVGAPITAADDFTPPLAPQRPTCKNAKCGVIIRKGTGRKGLCGSCYTRWRLAGRPEQVPPPSDDPSIAAMAEGRRALAAVRKAEAHDRYTTLDQDVETITKALGVTVATVEGYLDDLLAPSDTTTPTVT